MSSEFLFCLLLFSVLTISSVKSDEGFDCKTVSKCKALAGYVSPKATTLSDIATLFGVKDFNSFLATNSLPVDTPKKNPVAAEATIRIPFACSCNNGTGIADNTTIYKVKAGDGLDHIARNIFSMLVTYQAIAAVNGIPDPDIIDIGQLIYIPIPCSCDSVDGNKVVHYAHVVSPEDTLEMIEEEFGVPEKILLTLNHLDNANELMAESVLDVPLKDEAQVILTPPGTSPSGPSPPGTPLTPAEAQASTSSPSGPSTPTLTPPTPSNNRNNSPILAISIGIVVPSAIIVLSAIAFWFFCFQRKKTKTKYFDDVDDDTGSTESLQFNFSIVSTATDNFSEVNKLGEGGFGSVYKGTLSDGQEIAVKRLSKNSGQGEREFKNEVTLVAKLQHKNLVKLVGFSVAGEEKLLIYEFMPNASLDQFLFDPIKCTQLGWERRYKIIVGVARGLLYLHEESRLKIVHRDLKASNILLDMDMNPKIADFGMARLFVPDQTQASTKTIVGTYGYMAPEYLMHGKFSVKSDVFSFGVLVLEILCGKRNISFDKPDIDGDLLSYAWRHWNNRSAIDILDPTLKNICSRTEVARCIHVALLCVQANVADRPFMRAVVQMLNSYLEINHDLPSAPAFFAGSTMEPKSTLYLGYSEEQGSSKNESTSEAPTSSVNEVSATDLYPR